MRWASTLMPLAEALSVLLGLLRDAGVPHKVVAPLGQFQQSLPQGRVYQLLRLRLPDGHDRARDQRPPADVSIRPDATGRRGTAAPGRRTPPSS